MARCRCEGGNCVCALQAGGGVTVTGTGSPADPWIVSAVASSTGTFKIADTQTIDLVLTGSGTPADPFILSGHATVGVPGAIATGHGVTGDGTGTAPLRLDVCTYDDLAAACAP